jgi:hypothetical protein
MSLKELHGVTDEFQRISYSVEKKARYDYRIFQSAVFDTAENEAITFDLEGPIRDENGDLQWQIIMYVTHYFTPNIVIRLLQGE